MGAKHVARHDAARFFAKYVALVFPLALLVGCGGRPASVSGTVTLDGKPLERGMVGFAPTTGGVRAAGVIESDGSYTLRTNRDSGLDTGEFIVTVVSREPGEPPADGAPPMPGPYITPKHFAIGKTSGLTATVESGGNTIDIELSSDESQGGQAVKR